MAINHGTRGGYYAHRRLGDTPCGDCRAAINEYVKEYRQKHGVARNREMERVRRRALATLRDRYRDEYEQLVSEIAADEIPEAR